MRKIIYVVSLAAATALATSASAAPGHYRHYRHPHVYYRHPRVVVHPRPHAAAPTAGVVGGTAAGVAVSQGWVGGTVGAALPATAAGAAAVGGVVGMGTLAVVDAALEPCRGFAALFDLSDGECVDGRYVGHAYAPPPPPRRYRYR